jgi:hypothetical protein
MLKSSAQCALLQVVRPDQGRQSAKLPEASLSKHVLAFVQSRGNKCALEVRQTIATARLNAFVRTRGSDVSGFAVQHDMTMLALRGAMPCAAIACRCGTNLP